MAYYCYLVTENGLKRDIVVTDSKEVVDQLFNEFVQQHEGCDQFFVEDTNDIAGYTDKYGAEHICSVFELADNEIHFTKGE